MARYETTARTDWNRQEAFDYLADFSSVSDWDPSIPHAKLTAGEPLTTGATYAVDFELLGRTVTFTYEVIEVEAPEKVVLRATESAMTSTDTMTFRSLSEGGTEVTYVADIALKGPLKLTDPLFSAVFNRVGDRARDGLRERLDGAPPSR
jgi:hypothetical protein